MSFLDSSLQVLMSFLVCVRVVDLCSGECCMLHGSNVGPLGGYVEEVQSLKPIGNLHWLLDYPFAGYSMASSHALNSPYIREKKQ